MAFVAKTFNRKGNSTKSIPEGVDIDDKNKSLDVKKQAVENVIEKHDQQVNVVDTFFSNKPPAQPETNGEEEEHSFFTSEKIEDDAKYDGLSDVEKAIKMTDTIGRGMDRNYRECKFYVIAAKFKDESVIDVAKNYIKLYEKNMVDLKAHQLGRAVSVANKTLIRFQ